MVTQCQSFDKYYNWVKRKLGKRGKILWNLVKFYFFHLICFNNPTVRCWHHTLNEVKYGRGNEDAQNVLKYYCVKHLKWRCHIMVRHNYHCLGRTEIINKYGKTITRSMQSNRKAY